MMKITYVVATGEITGFGLRGNITPADGEELLEVTEKLNWREYQVVDGELVVRDTPLPDPLEQIRADEAAYYQNKLSIKEAIESDPIMQTLLNKTPAQVFAAVDAQVTDLASAKELLKRLAAVCAFLLQLKGIVR
jgi:hypothetical protein